MAGCAAAAWHDAGDAASCAPAVADMRNSNNPMILFVAIDVSATAQLVEHPTAVRQAHEVEQIPIIDGAIGRIFSCDHRLHLSTQLCHSVVRRYGALRAGALRVSTLHIGSCGL